MISQMALRKTLVAVVLAIGFTWIFLAAKAAAQQAADDDDNRTSTVIAYCSAEPNSNWCQMEIGLGVAMGLAGKCVPTSMQVPSGAQVLQVVDWLKAHPDVHPDDRSEAIDAAEAALYPCAN